MSGNTGHFDYEITHFDAFSLNVQNNLRPKMFEPKDQIVYEYQSHEILDYPKRIYECPVVLFRCSFSRKIRINYGLKIYEYT